MAYVLTNKTAQTPLGFGALGFTLEAGQSATVTPDQFAQVEAHPAMAAWIHTGMVSAEPVVTDEAEAARLAAEEAAKLSAPEVLVTPPKVPTPTAKK